MMTSTPTLPASIEAERATLGAILLNRDAIVAIADWLLPEHFYSSPHGQIYDAMLACYHRRVPPDIRTVAEELRRRGLLEDLGGAAMLVELVDTVPTAYHVEHYARAIEQAAVRRQLLAASGRIAALAHDETIDLEQTLDAAEASLFAVSERRSTDDFLMLGQVVDHFYEQLQQRQDQAQDVSGLATSFVDLDRLTGGLQPSDLIVLAARPSVGKTALALSLAHSIAMRGDATVGIFSLEMSRDQLLHRLLAIHSGIDAHKLRAGPIRDADLARVMEAMGTLAAAPLAIDDTAGQSIMAVRSKARRLQARRGLDLLIVDYLQLMQGRRQENRVQEVSEVARGLKNLARELNVPVIALSQLSRAVEGRAGHVPQLSDLRESGEIEQAADIVMFIHREEMYDRETDKKGIAELHIAKHRNGPVGVVPLRFEARTTRFQSLGYGVPGGW